MSFYVYVYAVRDPDGRFGEMLQLKAACDKVKATYPPELEEYFKGTSALDYSKPDDVLRVATEVTLESLKITRLIEGDAKQKAGAVIDLSKLPPDIKKLRITLE